MDEALEALTHTEKFHAISNRPVCKIVSFCACHDMLQCKQDQNGMVLHRFHLETV